MPTELLHHALNVGVVDKNKLFRVDLEKLRLASEDQTNIFCDAVGRAFLRPGTEHMGTALAKARILSFVAGGSEAFVLELTAEKLRVWDADTGDLVTRPAVTAAVANGNFTSGASWQIKTTSGSLASDISGGELRLDAFARGAMTTGNQQVACNEPGTEHALRIVVTRGPVTLRIGATEGGTEFLPGGVPTVLLTGEHSITFTPTVDFFIQFESTLTRRVAVSSCNIEAAGTMELPTPWTEALLKKVRVTQSLDVMFVACEGVKQRRIERRSDTAWSVVEYDANDGPFLVGRTADVKLTPAATEGNTTLTASKEFFTAKHVGALFKLYHDGQKIDTRLAAKGEVTPTFMVTGITETNFEERKWTVDISGANWTGTLQHERSFDGDDIEFHPFRRAQGVATIDITANATFTNDDNDDNAITYYRMKMREHTFGDARIVFEYSGGGGHGICRVTGYTSPTQVDIEVLKPFKGTGASADWQEGAWSALRGYPAGVVMHEGRLIWVGQDRIWGSVSDAYSTFDEDFVGDAGPLLRSIAIGGRNEARWALPLSSLLIGCDARIANVRASSLDEILTPDNFAIKSLGKIGAASLTPVEAADDRALFAHASGNAIYEVSWSSEKSRYLVTPFSKLTTDLLASGIADMGISTLPDQRIWVPTTDDDAVMVVFEPSQQVVAHIPVSTSAATDFIESVAVVPGTDQDRVWFSVKRVVNGNTVRYIERLALDSEAHPADITKCMDSHVTFGAGSATISGLDHLEGRTVVAWMDGDAVNVDDSLGVQQVAREFTVASGAITLPSIPATGGCVGLKYRGRFKMARLAYSVGEATSVLKKKTPAAVGFLLSDLCRSGLKLGTRFDDADHPLRSLHELVKGETIAEVITGMQADEDMHSLSGEIELDPRVCLEMNSPKPCTVNSLILGLETHG